MRKIRHWTSKEEQFLIEHYATHSNKRLSEMMGRSVASIRNRSGVLGLTKVPTQYALYKGDELLHIGTIKEIAEAENVKRDTIHHYQTPTYLKRRKNNGNFRKLVRLDE